MMLFCYEFLCCPVSVNLGLAILGLSPMTSKILQSSEYTAACLIQFVSELNPTMELFST